MQMGVLVMVVEGTRHSVKEAPEEQQKAMKGSIRKGCGDEAMTNNTKFRRGIQGGPGVHTFMLMTGW